MSPILLTWNLKSRELKYFIQDRSSLFLSMSKLTRTFLLLLCYSMCGPWTSITGITWEFVRNVEFLVPLQNYRIRIHILPRSSVTYVHIKVWQTLYYTNSAPVNITALTPFCGSVVLNVVAGDRGGCFPQGHLTNFGCYDKVKVGATTGI